MNRLHAMTIIQRAVLDDGMKDPKDVFLSVRAKFPTSGHDQLLSRAEVEQFAAQSISMLANAHFPVERARLALDIREGELRADILDGIAALDISNPRDCRDVYELHQRVGGSIGEPTLREAIDILKAGGQDVAGLVERCDEIYPPQQEDAE